MYLSYYHLQRNPFQISTDPRFLWLGPKHEEGLATLRYGIQDNKGFLLLTGDVGTGKTTLVNALLKILGHEVLVAVIRDPNLEPLDFYNYIAHAFNMGQEFSRKVSFLIQFEKFLHDAYAKKKKVLLVIDEAQRISQELLEEVRLLSNIEREDSKLLNIFFVGQIEFNEILLQPENRPIRQRITVNYNILPLTEPETGDYIRHRLEIAVAEKGVGAQAPSPVEQGGEQAQNRLESTEKTGEIFAAEAIKRIFAFSGGYPRLINIICDRCLLTGFVEEAETITAGIVEECITELTITPPDLKKIKVFHPVAPVENNMESPAPAAVPTVAKPPGHTKKMETVAVGRPVILAALVLLLLAIVLVSLWQGKEPGLATFSFPDSVKGFLSGSLGRNEIQEAQRANQEKGEPVAPGAVEPSPPAVQETAPDRPAKAEADQIDPAPAALPVAGAIVPAPLPAEHQRVEAMPPATAVDPAAAGQQMPGGQGARNVIAMDEAAGVQIIPALTGEKLVIPFPSDSNFVSADSLGALNTLVETLLLRPGYKVNIKGYTDAIGSENYNIKLSEFRANTIKSYLVGRGLNDSQITTQGMGSKDPVVPNDSATGRLVNRRVEIEIIQ